MSRSRRHTPICGITTARSEKDDKLQAHRRLRARTRSVAARAHPDTEPVWPGLRDVSDPWAMAKDGKRPFDPPAGPNLCENNAGKRSVLVRQSLGKFP